ncbi:MAG: FKBP-type peptidyl-prolyl cis-trans isomerase [Phycisphaerales bacterium]|nr:FKBP-type peptidyl-prolyl cis-trans isomerase [Phycisphaerales bacterium]
MKKLVLMVLLVSTFLITSCNFGYKTTASGVSYKITKHGSTDVTLKNGNLVKFNVKFYVQGKDSILNSTYGKIPAYIQVDTAQSKYYTFVSVLPYLHVGDNVRVSLSVDKLVTMHILQYNNLFAKKGHIICDLDVLDTFPNNQVMLADYNKESEHEKEQEIAEIEGDLKAHNVFYTKTADGNFYSITKEGNGKRADSGKAVSIYYTGALLSNDKKFDSNEDSSFHHMQPFNYVVGQPTVIAGWQKTIPLLQEDEEVTLYIPAMNAYGPQGAPPNIPPYADLKFTLTVFHVRDTTVKSQPFQFGGMNGMGNANQQIKDAVRKKLAEKKAKKKGK